MKFVKPSLINLGPELNNCYSNFCYKSWILVGNSVIIFLLFDQKDSLT